jgi:glutathione S-transferase
MELILYSAEGSNSSQRVEWALKYKKIPYQIHLTNSLSFGAYGYVPALSIDGVIISESMAILELLEEAFPEFPLLPTEVPERARIREVCEYVNSTIHPAQNRTILNFLRPNLTEVEKKALRAEWIEKCLQNLRPRLFCDSGFAIGRTFSLADIFVAVIYQKGLTHGKSKDSDYEDHWDKMSEIDGHEVVE